MKMHDKEEYLLITKHVRAAYKGERGVFVETTYEKKKVLGIFPISVPKDRYETRHVIHVDFAHGSSHYLAYETRDGRDADFDALASDILANIRGQECPATDESKQHQR